MCYTRLCGVTYMIKLVVSDLDGTLLHEGKVSKRNREAIAFAKENGASLVLATGRDFSMIEDLVEEFSCSSITGNGAEFRDGEGRLITSAYLKKEMYTPITEILLRNGLYFMVYTTDGFYSEQDPLVVRDAFLDRGKQTRKIDDEKALELFKHMPCMQLQLIEDVEAFLKEDKEIIKLEAFHRGDITPINNAMKELELVDGIAYLSSFNDNLEVTDIKAQKGMILQQVCKQLNIKEDEVMVVGDGMNDITMFERFKYSFAPSNSVEAIKEKAYKVVASCEDDGFSEAVYYMIKKELGRTS